MGYMLETRGLTKRFGRGDQAQDAVADVSLHIPRGRGVRAARSQRSRQVDNAQNDRRNAAADGRGDPLCRARLAPRGPLRNRQPHREAPPHPNLTARENLRVRTTLLGLPRAA